MCEKERKKYKREIAKGIEYVLACEKKKRDNTW